MKSIPPEHTVMKLADIAYAAGGLIMPYFRQNTEIQQKDDGSPVTLADREAEKFIISELSRGWPDIPAIGEENVYNTNNYTNSYNIFWLIDPLDGTREFVNGRDEFTVNIALIENSLPVTGVVYAPAKELMYIGDSLLGSYKIDSEGKLHKLPAINSADRPITVVISRSHPSLGQEESYLDELQKNMPVEIIKMGSSLKFCAIAEGAADFYFRAGTTMYWDSAAGHIVAKGADALVTEWGMKKELTYRDGKGLVNPAFMVLRSKWADILLK
ncbi:MAG: 3'(2'),5'-bisphosphate nucleotidase CysQ [Deferribacteraceae bacterium]|jgi:3'(2'), 5'-bisphosphate nucleotidase|nr:3'(2'),5'-bisphosphate nucleotidase CysQ [Deferribacteraceae bacterium]